MLTISKPLSASQAQTYHVREFASQEQNYWSRDQQGHSEWQGRLAEQWGLQGGVGSEHFARLSEGQHPHTEEQLVRHQVSRTYEGKFGREVTSAEHRAGWDATFSAPKSVSLTALVGDDDRVREAHRESVRAALQELERYAMTSHSSQGHTANRVLIHVDTELAAKDLLNSRMAYVSISRGAHDAQLFTNDREKLPTALGHDISKQTAQVPQINAEQTMAPQQEISKGTEQDHGLGFGLGF
jgi:hypothetical protein